MTARTRRFADLVPLRLRIVTLAGGLALLPALALAFTFAPPAKLATGSTPNGVAVADLNSDSWPDLVTFDYGLASNTVSVLLGNGPGTYLPRVAYPVGTNPAAVAIGDVNEDGKLDLVVSNWSSANVSVLLGNGAGGFGPQTTYGTGGRPISGRLAQMNGDGHLDLVVADWSSSTLDVMLGSGTGGFGTPTQFTCGAGAYALALADLDGDGKVDAVVANRTGNSVSVFRGTGAGSFLPRTDYGVGAQPTAVVLADFNGDGRLDLATSNQSDTTVTVRLGDGLGGFGARADYGAGPAPIGLDAGDLDGDGRVDLAVANSSGNTVALLAGSGTGVFAAPVKLTVGAGPLRPVVADVNLDLEPDLLVALSGADSIAVLRNTTASVQVPSPANSTCPTTVRMSADGSCCFDVVVRDIGANPIPGSTVTIDFGACGITFCPTQPPGVVVNPAAKTATAITNAAGVAHFCICATISPGCTASIYADGVLLCSGLALGDCANNCVTVSCCERKPQWTDPAFASFTGQIALETTEAVDNSDYVLTAFNLDSGVPPLNTNWDPPSGTMQRYHGPVDGTGYGRWRGDVLGSVFGITLDDQGNVYVCQTSCYGTDRVATVPGAGHGGIYKIDKATGLVSTFATLPNSADPSLPSGSQYPELGNISFDCTHDQFFVSDLEDGKIYRLDTNGAVLSSFDPLGADLGTPGFAPLGELVWAVQYQDGRVYYSVWSSYGYNAGAGPNTIRSVGLTAAGNFLSGSDRLEITVPGYLNQAWSNPVSDMAFETNGDLLLAERSMSGLSWSSAHQSRMLHYSCSNGTWSPSSLNFSLGTYGTLTNSAGGVAVDHDNFSGGTHGRVWGTADAIHFSSNDYVYGLQGLPPGGGSVANSYLVDNDGVVSSSDKLHQGDVEVPCPAATTGACPDTMVLHLTFNDGADLGHDSSGRNHHAVIDTVTAAVGRCANALHFGADNNVNELHVPTHPDLNITGAMSAAAWVKVLGTQSPDGNAGCPEGTVFCKGGANWFQIGHDNNQLEFQNEPSGNEVAIGTTTIPVGVWTLVGYVRGPMVAGNQPITFYVNGLPVPTTVWHGSTNTGSNNLNNAAFTDNDPLMIGNYGFQNDPRACELNGDIDELRIYDRALSAAQMAAMMYCPCPDSSTCGPADSLVVSTGFDQDASALLADGAADNEWVVVADPDPTTHEPRPAFVIPTYSAWAAPQAGSKWISAFPTAAHETNGTYTLEYRFCLLDSLGASISTRVRADDRATLYLNGHLLGTTGLNTFKPSQLPVSIGTSNQTWFKPGSNVLRVDLENVSNVAMGLDLVGSIHGNAPLYYYCCNDSSAGILGSKFNDLNRNGIWDPGEQALSGWTIHLSNGQSTTTDVFGDYYFTKLVPGTYTVTEVPQAGWTQTAPPSGGYTLALGLGEIAQHKDFGNSRGASPGGPIHGMDWLHDAFPFNENVGLPGTASFDTTTALVVTGHNIAQTTGNGLRFDIPGDSLVACACGDSTRMDLVFRILPGPGNYKVSAGRTYPLTGSMQLLRDPHNQTFVAAAGDPSFWGQYLADNGAFGSPGGHPAGRWSENVWNSARMDTAEFNIFPVASLGNLPGLNSCMWSGTYHESDPKYATLGIVKFRCFVVDTLQPATSGPVLNNVRCDGTVPAWLTTVPASRTGWNGTNTTREYTKIIPDGLLTPGSHVEYFLRRSRLATPSVFTMVPDTNLVWPQFDELGAAGDPCAATGRSSNDGHRWQQFGVLPDRWKDPAFGGPGMACMLYVDQADGHGDERAWVTIAEQLGATAPFKYGSHNGWHVPTLDADPNDPANFVRTHHGQAGSTWDLYSVRLSDDVVTGAAGSLGGRLANRIGMGYATGKYARIAPTPQMLRTYYREVFLSTAEQSASIFGPFDDRSQDEIALFNDYLTTVGPTPLPRALHVMGNGFVEAETQTGLSYVQHTTFLNTRLALSLRNVSYSNFVGNACPDLLETSLLSSGPNIYAVGNGGGISNDVLNVLPASTGVALAFYENTGPNAPYIASVGHPAAGPQNWITMTDGFGLQDVYSRFCANKGGRRNFLWDAYSSYLAPPCTWTGSPNGTVDAVSVPLANGLVVRTNPARGGRAAVRLSLAHAEPAELAVYDLAGRRVRTLVKGALQAGVHDVAWDGRDDEGHRVAAGVFFVRVRLQGSGFTQSRTLVMIE